MLSKGVLVFKLFSTVTTCKQFTCGFELVLRINLLFTGFYFTIGPNMTFHMFFNAGFSRESLFALTTDVRLSSTVGNDVAVAIDFLVKLFVTLIAFQCAFTSVRLHVAVKISSFCKMLKAVLAHQTYIGFSHFGSHNYIRYQKS